MLSLRNRFGIPGVISVVALVFALVGGAYAANGSGDGATASAKKKNRKGSNAGLSGKQKKQVIQIARREAKKFQGTGPAGPQGLPGAAGVQGPKGDNGSNGSNGSNGTSATVASFEGSKGTCTEGQGGLEVNSASPTAYVCNGTEGEQGEPGVLQPGETLCSECTETGGWYLKTDGGGEGYAPISFTIPLAAPLEEANTHPVTKEDIANEEVPAACTVEGVEGSAEEPLAQSGHFCIYEGTSTENEAFIFGVTKIGSSGGGTSTSGALISVLLFAGESAQQGTWAVTG